jgi:hypothetical protein
MQIETATAKSGYLRFAHARKGNVGSWPIATLSFAMTTAFTPERTIQGRRDKVKEPASD